MGVSSFAASGSLVAAASASGAAFTAAFFGLAAFFLVFGRPEAVAERLSVYSSQTEPLLGYYRGKGVLVEVDVDRSPEEVQKTLIEVLSEEG